MRAISLWQPWASLWLSPRKIHETRHWSTDYRGWLVVHAAKRLVNDCGEDIDDLMIADYGAMWRRSLPRGALLGMVNLVDCVHTEEIITPVDDRVCGNFSEGRYGWKRDTWMRFREPIPYKGRQGFFQVPDDLIEQARRAA